MLLFYASNRNGRFLLSRFFHTQILYVHKQNVECSHPKIRIIPIDFALNIKGTELTSFYITYDQTAKNGCQRNTMHSLSPDERAEAQFFPLVHQ